MRPLKALLAVTVAISAVLAVSPAASARPTAAAVTVATALPAGSIAQQSVRAAAGELRVAPVKVSKKGLGRVRVQFAQIQGLGSTAYVSLTGGGKKWKISSTSKSKVLKLKPGKYKITASTSALPNGGVAVGYASETVIQVKSGALKTVRASWSNRTSVPVEVLDSARVKGSMSVAPGVSGDAEGLPGWPAVNIPLSGTQGVKPGEIVQIPVGTAGWPYGFLGKALSVSGDTVVAEFINVLTVYRDIHVEQVVSSQDVNVPFMLGPTSRSLSFKADCSADLKKLLPTGMSIDATLDIQDLKLKTFGFTTSIGQSGAAFDFTSTISAECAALVEVSVPLGNIPLFQVNAAFGPFASASASGTVRLKPELTLTSGFQFANGQGRIVNEPKGPGDLLSVEGRAKVTLLGLKGSIGVQIPPKVENVFMTLDNALELVFVENLNSLVLDANSADTSCYVKSYASWDAHLKFIVKAVNKIGWWDISDKTVTPVDWKLADTGPMGEKCWIARNPGKPQPVPVPVPTPSGSATPAPAPAPVPAPLPGPIAARHPQCAERDFPGSTKAGEALLDGPVTQDVTVKVGQNVDSIVLPPIPGTTAQCSIWRNASRESLLKSTVIPMYAATDYTAASPGVVTIAVYDPSMTYVRVTRLTIQ